MVSTVEKSGSVDISELITENARDGFCIARGLLSEEEVAEIRNTFTQAAGNGPVEGLSEIIHSGRNGTPGKYHVDDPLSFYPRMMHPHRHSDKPVGPLARKYMLDRRLEPILASLLNDQPLAVQSMFYFKPPGARGQSLHQDNFFLRVKPGTCVAAWIAVDDTDQENGGMVAGQSTHGMEIACPEKADSSKYFTTEHVEPPAGSRILPIDMRAGDVLFFNGSVIHGSYPNNSPTRFRRSLIFHYVPRHSQELAHWYMEPMTFDGEVIQVPLATGGGPCGTLDSAGAPH